MTEANRRRTQARLERIRDRIIRHLPIDALTTDAATEIALKLQDSEREEPAETAEETFRWSPLGSEDGVIQPTAQDLQLQILRDPVQSASELLETAAQPTNEIDIEEPLRNLYTALQSTHCGDASLQLIDSCWHEAARAATAIAGNGDLSINATCFGLAREVLFASASHRLPELRPDLASFDSSPSWGLPAPRTESAGGLLYVALREKPLTDDVLQLIRALSTDSSPEVRFVVAGRLHLLSHSPDTMWHFIEEMKDDSSTAVLMNLAGSLSRVVHADDSERIVNNLQLLLDRGHADAPGAGKLRKMCTQALAASYVWRGTELAGDVLFEQVSAAFRTDPRDFAQLSRVLRDAYAFEGSSDKSSDARIRGRAIELSRVLLESSTQVLRDQLAELAQNDDDDLMKRTRAVAELVDGIASDMFIVSGAYDVKRKKEPELSTGQLERLYQETAPILDLLSEVPIAGVTHHVLEALSIYVPFDPKGVFLRVAHTIEFGTGGAYQLDSLGATLVVGLLERYLAEHRTLLQTDSDCQDALIQILDTFVDAGWPQARRLTYGLEEIFR